jgi:threonine/homoserine/homoserine lactone efflux protein
MNFSEAIIKGILLGLFMAISVGPTLFAIIRYSMHHSYKAGIAFILGVSVSDIIYVVLANIATNWLEFLEDHQRTVGYIGSGLFVLMGLFSLLRKYKPKRPRQGKALQISAGAYFKIWGTGFLMNALNPAVILLWVGAAISVTGSTLAPRAAFFGVCLGIVLGFDLIKVFLADKIRRRLTLRRIMYLNRISALCILIFGFILFAKVYFNIELGH